MTEADTSYASPGAGEPSGADSASAISSPHFDQHQAEATVLPPSATQSIHEATPFSSLAPALELTLHQPVPTKARPHRSDSQLTADRPAPPSPVPSRPSSTLLASSSNGSTSSRDRAGSTASSQGRTRRQSRTSGTTQPRSTLGSISLVPQDTAQPATILLDSSLATTPIPEGAALPSEPPTPPKITFQAIVIRDYAFEQTDDRHMGVGAPFPPTEAPRSSSRWQDGESSPDPSQGSSSTFGNKKGWSGFGLLGGWKFMSRSPRSSVDPDSSRPEAEDDDEDEENDYPLPVPDHDEDDYAFSSASSQDGEADEPSGLYRAAYAFEAVGEHEIGLEEGDLVELRGRGGGDGWVIGVRKKLMDGKIARFCGEEEKEKEGLVPEGYLEKVPEDEYGKVEAAQTSRGGVKIDG